MVSAKKVALSDERNVGMRVRPSARVGALIAVVYTMLFIGLLLTVGADIPTLASDVASARRSISVLGFALIVSIVVTAFLGWWGPVRREARRLIGWMWFVPLIMLAAILASFDYGSLMGMEPRELLWIAAAAALVGTIEELVFRGLVLVGLRGSTSEMSAYVWSTVAFAVFHLSGAVEGAGVATAALQVLVAFIAGTLLYLSRRAAGTIIVPMALHALWNFSAFTSGGDHPLSALALVTGVIVFGAFLVQRRQAFRYIYISPLPSRDSSAALPAWQSVHRSSWATRP
jgi:membrane protease YdiL (CAAX protease family)